MHRDQRPEGGLAALDLLARERLGDVVEAGAAVLLRDDDPEDPELGHALDQIHVELVVDVVLHGDRQDALVHEGADGVLDQPLLVGELEVHAPSFMSPRQPGGGTRTSSSTTRRSGRRTRAHPRAGAPRRGSGASGRPAPSSRTRRRRRRRRTSARRRAALYVWKPSLKTQWYATGIVSRNAIRPDQRWTTLIFGGRCHGSLRKIHAAVKSCVTPRSSGGQREPRLQMQRVAEEEPEPGAGVGARRDDQLAGDDPDRLRDEEAREKRDEQMPGRPALRRRRGGGRHRLIQRCLASRRKGSYH